MTVFTVGVRWVRRSATERCYYDSPEQALLHVCESSDKATGSIHDDVFDPSDPFFKIEKVHAVLCNGALPVPSTRRRELKRLLISSMRWCTTSMSYRLANNCLSRVCFHRPSGWVPSHR